LGGVDFKYMPRGFAALDDTEEIFRCDVLQLAACSRMLTFKMLEHTAMRRMALSIVALHGAANIVDYYITMYVAKPKEQLQNLIAQYALGYRRLEDEEAADQQVTKTDPKVRAKRVTILLQMAANFSTWSSATEAAAIFVHCREGHFITHQDVPVFLSRVWLLMLECQRMSQRSHGTVRNAATAPITTIDYDYTRLQILANTGNESLTHEPDAALGVVCCRCNLDFKYMPRGTIRKKNQVTMKCLGRNAEVRIACLGRNAEVRTPCLRKEHPKEKVHVLSESRLSSVGCEP
jgi:hypothetical protein